MYSYNTELNLHHAEVADIVRKALLKKYKKRVLRDGWKVVDIEVDYSEKWAPGEGEFDEGWSYNEMQIYVKSEKKCGQKQVLRTKKERLII
jgi:hypothetical protein